MGGVPLQCCLQMVYRKGSEHKLVVNRAVQCGDGAVLPSKEDRLPWLLPAVSPPVCLLQHQVLPAPTLPAPPGAAFPAQGPRCPVPPPAFPDCSTVHRLPRALPAAPCTAHVLHCPLPALCTACAAPCTTSSTSQPAALCPALPVPCATCSTMQRLQGASPGALHTACGAVRCCSTVHCPQHRAPPPFIPCTSCSDIDHLQHCAVLVLCTTLSALLSPALCTVGSSAPPALCTARSVTHGCTPCCLQPLALPTGDCTTCRAMHAMLCVLPGASRTTCSIPYCLCDVYLLFCARPAVPWTVFTVHCVP